MQFSFIIKRKRKIIFCLHSFMIERKKSLKKKMRKRTSTLFRFHQISCKHINHIYENLISEKNTIVLLAFFHEWINNVLLWKRIGIPASLRISIIFKVLIENYISIFDKSTSRVGKRRNFIYNNCFFNEKMGKFMKFSIFEIIELLPRDWNT